jgi:hypothetical protein
MSAPLDDLARRRPQPRAGRFARHDDARPDLGARVSNVEAPADGDGTRGWGPPFRLVAPGVLESRLDFTAAAASAAPHPAEHPRSAENRRRGAVIYRGASERPYQVAVLRRSHFEWSN